MNIWTRPFLVLFLSAAALGSLLVIFPSPAPLYWLALDLILALCLVGWRVGRSRLLRAGFLLQGLLIAVDLFLLVPGLQLTLLFTFSGGQYVSSIFSLLNVIVFLSLSYGLAPWQASQDARLTTVQVVLALGLAGLLILGDLGITVNTSNITVIIVPALFLASQFFVVLLLLLRGAAWRRAPIAIALLLVVHLIETMPSTLTFLIYAFISNHAIFFILTGVLRAFSYLSRAALPLLFLGLLALVQSERVRRDPQPEPVPASPVPS